MKTPTEVAEVIVNALDAAGYVIAPKEPTPRMKDAGAISHAGNAGPALEIVGRIYRAMIAKRG